MKYLLNIKRGVGRGELKRDVFCALKKVLKVAYPGFGERQSPQNICNIFFIKCLIKKNTEIYTCIKYSLKSQIIAINTRPIFIFEDGPSVLHNAD